MELDIEPTPVPDPAPLPGARLVVVESVYHQPEGAEPESVVSNFTRYLTSDDDLFRRRQSLRKEWRQVEAGHVRDASVLHLAHERRPRQKLPTPQEEEADRRPMEVSLRGDGAADLRVPPGESVRLTGPADLSEIMIRQESGVGRCIVTVVPE